MLHQAKFRNSYRGVLFLGQTSLFNILKARPKVFFDRCRVFFTHLVEESALSQNQIKCLNSLEKIFTMNRLSKQILEAVGVKTSISVVYGAVDQTLFNPYHSDISNKYVLISCVCAPRKNPEGLINFIESNPKTKFIIHGNNWSKYKKLRFENLEILNFSYQKQPKLMRDASAFMSYSWFEGGPFPVLEALASGTPVLATRTGFAPDLVDISNGRIIESGDSLFTIQTKLKECMELKELVKSKNLLAVNLTWELLANSLYN